MIAAGLPRSRTRLGLAYPNYADLAPYPDRVAAQVAAFEEMHGRPPTSQERNRITSKEARRGRRAVAGFDLVFTPVKSASLLWGLGGPEVRAAVEAAHHEAVHSAIGWVERHAAYTRTGKGGIAQIDATGLVCAAFDHRESRSGDPDLHTHVAVANKVCGVDGKWRSLDARNLYALGVAASERYNTRFEDALASRLGVEFTERVGTGADGKRPVREIVGVPVELIGHFSRRRAAIEDRYAELRADYRTAHGREPDHATQLQLAQQATLETREGKPPGRTLAEQTADWTEQARGVIGRRKLDGLVTACVGRRQAATVVDDELAQRIALDVVRTVAETRSTWTIWNLHAETERRMRGLRFATPADREAATARVLETASSPAISIRIAESDPELELEDPSPAQVRDSDRRSVFIPHGSDRYTTSEILTAEDRLVAAGRTTDAPHLDRVLLDAALAVHESKTGVGLDAGQRLLVEHFATTPARLAVGIGPAGAGKTTAMRAFATTWHTAHAEAGGRVVPLATSAKAAQVLGAELDTRAENLHKFLHEHHRPDRPGGPADDWFILRPGDVVLLDEAGMAGTLHLAQLVQLATASGAAVRLLGDPAQLAAVDAGGALGLLEREVGAAHLTDLHRFRDPDEGAATLQLRTGDTDALDYYEHHNRIHAGARDAMLEHAYDAWATDIRAGRTSVLVAAASTDVTALNARARLERVLAGQVAADGLTLRDGTTAGVGDWVVTRANERTLRYRRTRWVHNGDTWRVTRQHRDGSLTLRHLDNRGTVRLPAGYVADSVELAYASTAHRVQGSTTDTAHALITAEMTREALYVASTRGRARTTWYVATETSLDADCHHEPDPPRTSREVLETVLVRTGAEISATETIRATLAVAASPETLRARVHHARAVAVREALSAWLGHLPDAMQQRILNDHAAGHLARVVADAVNNGADGSQLLRAAHDLDTMTNARSPAALLAARIQDHPLTLGNPRRPLGTDCRTSARLKVSAGVASSSAGSPSRSNQ